jgi:hypothetical protein
MWPRLVRRVVAGRWDRSRGVRHQPDDGRPGEYVADRSAAFADLYRVLRAGAALVVSTQHPTTDWLHKGGSYFDSVLTGEKRLSSTSTRPGRTGIRQLPTTA